MPAVRPLWLAACLAQACNLAGGLPVVKLVDVPSVVCTKRGGPGRMQTEIWPTDDRGAASYLKVGDGACGNRSEAEVPPATSKRPGPADRADCQELCDRNASCEAFDFCAGPGCKSSCRLFPRRQGRAYNESVEPESNLSHDFVLKCFVKQVNNHTKPHVVSFLRTSSQEVNVSFTLTDSHPSSPRSIVPWTNVTLQAFSRRLDASAVLGAKRRLSAPIRRGKGSGGHGGRGSGRGSSGRGSNGKTKSGSGRPGGSTRSGEAAAGRFSNPRNARAGAYGYSQRGIASHYPKGYAATSYGYSGISSHSQVGRIGVTSNTMSVVAGMYLFSRMGAMNYGLGHYDRYGYDNKTAFGYFNLSNSSRNHTSSDVGIGDPAEGELIREPFHDGVVEIPLVEDLRQDDMMATGFVPGVFSYPLILTVEAVQGADYDHDRICPPAGWHPNASLSADPSWYPPGHQDLFFSLTQLEDYKPADEDASGLYLLEFVVAAVAIMMAVSLCGRCCDEDAGAAELRRRDGLEPRGRQVAVSDLPARRTPPGTYAPLAKKLGSLGQLD